MTKNEIISKFYQSHEFTECIKRMNPDHLRNDLKSEVMLALCEEEEWFIQDLHSRGELKYWAVRIILNMVKSKSSDFYAKYRTVHAALPMRYDVAEEDDVSYQFEQEQIEKRAINCINELHWFEADLLKLYSKLGSYRAVAIETGFSHQCIQRIVVDTCKKIKRKVYAEH